LAKGWETTNLDRSSFVPHPEIGRIARLGPSVTIKTMTTTHTEHAPAQAAEGSVRSADGTRIGYRRLGSGPVVVFVHGSVSTHTDWMPVCRLLADRFTCFAMDRRGRAKSGEGVGPYSIEREYEDIEAVLATAGPGAQLVAHSYGATCALGTALRHPVPQLVLYEPPLPVGGLIAGENLKPYLRALEEGDPDRALEFGLAAFPGMPQAGIVALRLSKAWPRLRVLAKSWVRELEAMDALSADVEQYRALSCPSMMLMGTLSAEHPMLDASRALAQVLPGVRVEWLQGQGHGAMRTAPETVARLIGDFLSA
jgi:pimeloyl-ACP methyl ester carboxylesterase